MLCSMGIPPFMFVRNEKYVCTVRQDDIIHFFYLQTKFLSEEKIAKKIFLPLKICNFRPFNACEKKAKAFFLFAD